MITENLCFTFHQGFSLGMKSLGNGFRLRGYTISRLRGTVTNFFDLVYILYSEKHVQCSMDQSTEQDVLAELLTLRKEVHMRGDNLLTLYYNENGELHRVHGPAVIWGSGTKVWFQHNRRHRLNGPAVENTDGRKDWWEYGKHIRSEPS